MNLSYKNILEDIKSDNKSGASVIAQKTVDCLEALTKEKSDVPANKLIAEVERVAGEILKAQVGMAQLTNLFNSIFVTIEKDTSGDSLVL